MDALSRVQIPGYAAIIFRRTFQDLSLPGALIPRAQDWLGPTDATWNAQKYRWTFPSGATLSFGHLEHSDDRYNYQSSEFQWIGFDELTQFPEQDYLYLFSRLRRRTGVNVPLKMRGATNPGNVGHDWVKERFIGPAAVAAFVPARLDDNPYIDQAAYRESLAMLDAVTRAQLEEGNWEVVPSGELFARAVFRIVDAVPANVLRVRYWDKAGTEGGGAYTAGVRLARVLVALPGQQPYAHFFVEDVVRGQWSAFTREQTIMQTAQLDGRGVQVWVEQEPGSGGKDSALATVAMLAGWDAHAERVTGDKVSRARPFAAQAEAGNVSIVRGAWNRDFINEARAFPNGPYLDQVDAAAGAFNKLALAQTRPASAGVAQPSGGWPFVRQYQPR